MSGHARLGDTCSCLTTPYRLCRGVIVCILLAKMPLRELGSGHARLGKTIVGYIPHEKSHVVWYFTEHNEVVTCQVTD